MKALVAYFSASGRTAKVASALAKKIDADVFEIKPTQPYTESDLKWANPIARCNKEKFGKKDVPVEGKVENFDTYDTVFIGFPIWYYAAPNVINTFCKDYDWTEKKVYAFATSGGSGIGKTAEKLEPYVKGAESVDAMIIKSKEDLLELLKGLK